MLDDLLEEAVLIVAHPDDEMLWFSGILEQVRQVFICFTDVPGIPQHTAGRRAAAESFPLPNITFLHIGEAMSFQGADWSRPVSTEYGLEVRQSDRTLEGFNATAYQQNFQRIIDAVSPHLDGASALFSHNPWGEYGHEDHVQVFRAVNRLATTLGLEHWYTNYVSDRATELMRRELATGPRHFEMRSTNIPLSRQLEAFYREHECWTWPFEDYEYFSAEAYIRHPGTERGRAGARLPLNYIDVDRGRFPRERRLKRVFRALAGQ